MGRYVAVSAGIALAGLVAACSGSDTTSDTPPPPPPPSATVDCSGQTPVALAPGDYRIVDPAETGGCVRVPAAGSSGAEYVVVLASTSTQRSSVGLSGPYVVRTVNPGAAASPPATVAMADQPRTVRESAPAAFHMMLRERERALSLDLSNRIRVFAAPGVSQVPAVGDHQSFQVCGDLRCQSFVTVSATARYVGTHGAIFMDDNAPKPDTLLTVDYQDLGTTFDNYHYPIDVGNFGSESDIDGNGRVIILLTKAVNNLTPDCTNGRILGYFYGGDLVAGTGSNHGEVFYAFVPSPATSGCSAITRQVAVDNIKPTLIHEFQHMISFNQHAILRPGQAEETWLNEALSHFAEELGGRTIPDNQCAGFSSCRSQYISGDLLNTYDYLSSTESYFLIYPITSTGTLPERGASWSFLRWAVDHFATDTVLGSDMISRMDRTALSGVNNLVAVTGGDFPTMVVEWQLANYLDDLPNFTPSSDRLRYKSWGFRSIFTNPANQAPSGPFTGFPIKPDSISGSFTRSGLLRGGSGRHFRLVQAANGPAIDFQVAGNASGAAIDPGLGARVGIARIR